MKQSKCLQVMQVQLPVSYEPAIQSKFWAHLMQLSINYFFFLIFFFSPPNRSVRKEKKKKKLHNDAEPVLLPPDEWDYSQSGIVYAASP